MRLRRVGGDGRHGKVEWATRDPKHPGGPFWRAAPASRAPHSTYTGCRRGPRPWRPSAATLARPGPL
eukprot:6113267-Pyramimonas_sp.AAC.1